ncbi:polyketide cyclase [Streptomyces sp. A7024]|uniref:Polyketide cyclase n=1 Tax=Streptomyces coryli TaxID=1128680 RepID=A0A6G4TZJ8_9ACTN|nr:SRPBCC family protein [Streptomyces coryli]NGN65253.1 polyketide cyclase [Streptomyces coryli]
MRFETGAAIAAKPGDVWQAMAGITQWPEFNPVMKRVERLDDGDFGVGSKARVEQPGMPKMVWEVTEFEDGESFVWRTKSPGVTTVGGHAVRAEGDGAHVTLWVEQSGPLAPLIALISGARTRRYVETELSSLKTRTEQT